ncbi:MAG: response regulator transcription factor [Bdellovibrionaceae bacterium]|jgi:DNA-binding response OmpR family regulator|nr:response regulator transcription factor [Pseudobdellovibrionaceae bacterium]
MEAQKLFIIDDDVKLATVLAAYLSKFNFNVTHFADPNLGLEAVNTSPPQLIILDIMMPHKDGLQVCREIRQSSNIPIIFLSARGDTTDRIVGLELGADDYLAKPFEPRELVARIESILRRTPKNETTPTDPLFLNEDTMEAKLEGKLIDFTATEFQVLLYLYKNKNKIISRDELLTHLQGIDSEVYGRAIDILISRIRQKLNDTPQQGSFIKTVRSQGYRYIGEANET